MKKYHTTTRGEKMLIADMTDSHLQNTIAAKERWWQEQMKPYLQEAEKRNLRPHPWYRKAWQWVQRKVKPAQPVRKRMIQFLDDGGPLVHDVNDAYMPFDILDQEDYH